MKAKLSCKPKRKLDALTWFVKHNVSTSRISGNAASEKFLTRLSQIENK